MAIDSYSSLKTAIANWLDRTDLTDRIPEFIALAEARIGRTLRTRGVEERSYTLMVAGQQYYSLPNDFAECRNVQINTNPVNHLKYRTPQQIDNDYPYNTTGKPRVYTIIGLEIELKPIPNSTDQLEIAYFQRLSALSDSNTTNWLTNNAPDLLLYGALIEAETYLINDPRLAIWKGAFDIAMTEWNTSDDKARHSGSALETRIDGT